MAHTCLDCEGTGLVTIVVNSFTFGPEPKEVLCRDCGGVGEVGVPGWEEGGPEWKAIFEAMDKVKFGRTG